MSNRTHRARKTDGVVTLLEILSDMRASPGISEWDDNFCAVQQDAIRQHGADMHMSDTEVLILIEMRRRLLGVVVDAPRASDVRH